MFHFPKHSRGCTSPPWRIHCSHDFARTNLFVELTTHLQKQHIRTWLASKRSHADGDQDGCCGGDLALLVRLNIALGFTWNDNLKAFRNHSAKPQGVCVRSDETDIRRKKHESGSTKLDARRPQRCVQLTVCITQPLNTQNAVPSQLVFTSKCRSANHSTHQ